MQIFAALFQRKYAIFSLLFCATSCGLAMAMENLEARILQELNDELDHRKQLGEFRLEEGHVVYVGGDSPQWAVNKVLQELGMDPQYGTCGIDPFKIYTYEVWLDSDHYRYFIGTLRRRNKWALHKYRRFSGREIIRENCAKDGVDVYKKRNELLEKNRARAAFWGMWIQKIIPNLTQAFAKPKVLGLITLGVLIAIGLPIVVWHGARKFFEWVFTHRPTILGPADSDIYGFWHRMRFKFPKVPKVIVNPALQEQLNAIIKRNRLITKRNKGSWLAHPILTPYPHIMAYGTAGVGKTLFAKNLAKKSGMHFMYLTISDLSQLGEEEALQELKRFFAYAKKHGPTILIVDEADRLFAGEDLKAKKLALLFQREFSKAMHTKIQLFFITNYPNTFPLPILNRISFSIEFDPPSYDTQLKLLQLHLERQLHRQKKRMLKGFENKMSEQLLSGLVGRDIEAIALAVALAPSVSVQVLIEAICEKKRANERRKNFTMEAAPPTPKKAPKTSENKKEWI